MNTIEEYLLWKEKHPDLWISFTTKEKGLLNAIQNAQTKWSGQIFAKAAIRNDLNNYFSEMIK